MSCKNSTYYIRSGNDALANHVATVNDFMADYVSKDDSGHKTAVFERFGHHLVSIYWQKMCRRYRDWSSLGYIYHLSRVTLEVLDSPGIMTAIFTAEDFKVDTGLASVLVKLEDSNKIGEIMEHHPTIRNPSALSHLMSAFRTALEQPADERKIQYTKDICIEFHQLLVAVLWGYGNALQGLCKAVRESKELEADAKLVWEYVHLFWRIAYSRILHRHMAVLETGGTLQIPFSSQEIAYKNYTSFNLDWSWKGADAAPGMQGAGTMPGQDTAQDDNGNDLEKKGDANVRKEEGEGLDSDLKVDGNKDEDKAEEESKKESEEGDRNVENDPDLEDELKSLGRRSGSALAYERWMGMIATPLASLQVISSFCGRQQQQKRPPVKVTLLTSKYVKGTPEHWQDTVRKLVPPASSGDASESKRFDPDVAIAYLKQYSENIPKTMHPPGLKLLMANNFLGRDHCEMGLVAAMLNPRQAFGPDSPLCKLLEVRPHLH